MKRYFSILAMGLVLSIMVLGCKEDPPPPKSQEDINKELLMATAWVPASGSGQITIGDPPKDVTDSWSNFVLTFGDKSYTSSGGDPNATEVWPASGTWDFGSSANILIRDGSLEIAITVSETALRMQFDYTAGRINGIEGPWIFNMVPQ